jgi:peptidoglycan/LPS O-acetylase OafA/YrhL
MTLTDDRRVPVLDGLRGLAILLVLAHHVVIYSGMTREAYADRLVRMAGNAAWIGVDLFFVLSGFLITGILYDTKASPNYFTSFYGRRVLRIFPLYYGFLTVTLLAVPLWLSADAATRLTTGQGWYWSYLSNVQVALSGWQEPLHLGHFWSLAVEEQFYLLWPFVVIAFARRRLLQVAVACCCTALALRIVAPFGLSALGSYVLMPTRMDTLAAGAIVALLVRTPGGLQRYAAHARWAFAFGGASLAFLFVWRRGLNELDPVINTIGFSVIAVTFAALVAVVLTGRQHTALRRALSWPALRALAHYSYGLYVFHQPLAILIREHVWQADMLPRVWGSQFPGLAVYGLLVASSSLACAAASWHLWEVRFLHLKRHLPYGQPPPPPAPVAASGAVSAL